MNEIKKTYLVLIPDKDGIKIRTMHLTYGGQYILMLPNDTYRIINKGEATKLISNKLK